MFNVIEHLTWRTCVLCGDGAVLSEDVDTDGRQSITVI